jgi:hypothetical protein
VLALGAVSWIRILPRVPLFVVVLFGFAMTSFDDAHIVWSECVAFTPSLLPLLLRLVIL